MEWNVYLSGEIHSDWRDEIITGVSKEDLPVSCTSPVTDHTASDNCGAMILGEEEKDYWKDRKGAGINTIRTRTYIELADIVVVKFGEKYRQWNAAFDAGYAVAMGKRLIVMHPPEHNHALKEIDAAALAVTETPGQVVSILKYVTARS